MQLESALSQSASTDKTRKSSDRIFLAMTARSAGEPLADHLGSGLLAWLSSATRVFYSMLPFIALLCTYKVKCFTTESIFINNKFRSCLQMKVFFGKALNMKMRQAFCDIISLFELCSRWSYHKVYVRPILKREILELQTHLMANVFLSPLPK